MNALGEQKSTARIIVVGFLLVSSMIIITTPVHEAAHWVMSEIDPYIEPVEFHLFDETSFQQGDHMLSSALGCVIIREAYPGAFKERGPWADMLQEIICMVLQLALTCIVVLKLLRLIMNKQQVMLPTSAA